MNIEKMHLQNKYCKLSERVFIFTKNLDCLCLKMARVGIGPSSQPRVIKNIKEDC